MPRIDDPLGILTGGGLAPPGSVSPSSLTPGDVGAPSSALDGHVENPTGAHPATAISTVNLYERYSGVNVQVSLNDLAALIPPPMGGVGSEGVAWLGGTNVGTPDWGILKLWDGILPFTGNVAADARAVYPYYYRAPITASGSGVTGTGVEPSTDPTFNVVNGLYSGGGEGKVHAGFATIPSYGTGYPTWRIFTSIANPHAVVSGIVSPADRGVLALVKWPTATDPDPAPAANVTDIQDRCVAALLLGKGVLDNGCDGEPGGIFTETSGGERAIASLTNNTNPAAPYTITIDLTGLPGGPPGLVTFTATAGAPTTPYEFQVLGTNILTSESLALALNNLYFPTLLVALPAGGGTVNIYPVAVGTVGNSIFLSDTALPGAYTLFNGAGGVDAPASPYNFPGRAAGQYNLDEIHLGATVTLGGESPFFNPAAGQVRLLTDPAAVGFSPGTVAGGLPIFGATANAIGSTVPLPGFSFDLGGGTASNFFAYRLPYLKDYSVASGLVYTPTAEKLRFTTPIAPASVVTLDPAGAYDDFTVDFWAFQIARYRHRFTLATGAAMTRADDNYALVHFKKEAFFEAYVRDGVVPTSDQLYSVNLVQWTGSAAPYDILENLVTASTSPEASVANPVNRAEVVEDNSGTVTPTNVTLDVTYVTNGDTTYYSGVEYYVPIDRTTANDPAFGIQFLDLNVTNAFADSYRTHDVIPTGGTLSGDSRKYALNQNLAFLSLSPFSYEGTENPAVGGISSATAYATVFPGELGEYRRQRIEFGYADVAAASVDPFGPLPGDPLRYTLNTGGLANSIRFSGDTLTPAFTTDAKARLFVRRLLNVDGVTGYPLPYAGGTGAPARGFTLVNTTGDAVLFHSMREDNTAALVPYGNPDDVTRATLDSPKDVSERFLDEVYRYPENWTPLNVTFPADATQLQGPGLPFGPAPIAVPVRPVNLDPNYPGWFFQNFHTSVLDNATANLNNALQVAGLPPRNPEYTEGLTSPFSARGVLLYPQTDYSTGYAPVGPDYSVLTGDRVYLRAFNAGAANAGLSVVKFRLWGVDILDFQYTPPTAPGATGMAVMVKVPGLTTWMDAGRSDGAGPSKQDLVLDGAGCLVTSATGTDTDSQIHYTDITVNLSPAALFINGEGKCPVLVKVIIKDNVTGKSLNFVGAGETKATSLCRGLVGIDINP
jgi:hypothetical protein